MNKSVKKIAVGFLLANLIPIVLLSLVLFTFLGLRITSSGGMIGSTSLTAKEVAEKANISEETAEHVLKILNWQMSKEGFTLEGASGSLANAERESNFNPKAVNPSGGVAGYFQWSGWDGNTVNGDRWANAKSRTLDSQIELELMSYELNNGYKKVKDYMQKATAPFESAKYWSEHYEGVALSDGQTKVEKLKKDSEKWYNIFKGTLKKTKNKKVVGGGQVAVGQILHEVPSGYTLDKDISTDNYVTQSYDWGECTWYVYNRAKDFSIHFDPYMGNGGEWWEKEGYETTNTPTKHSAVSFIKTQAGGHKDWGHVAFVEDVKDDGSILISESNFYGRGKVNYRIFSAEDAKQFHYVIGK